MSRCLTCIHYAKLTEPFCSNGLTFTGVCKNPSFTGTGKGVLCASSIGFASMCAGYAQAKQKTEEAA